MIRRLYVHNFRCLENFELDLAKRPSVLLIGKNGAGKTTVGQALEILQRIARGTNRVEELVKPKDFSRGRNDVPIRFEVEVEIGGGRYEYSLALDFSDGFKGCRVLEEKLSVEGKVVFSREKAQVNLAKSEGKAASFLIDWHLAALPIVQEQTKKDPLYVFRNWFSRSLILRPLPALIAGDSAEETLQPNPRVTDFGAWFSGLVASAPAAYGKLDQYLKEMMPDLAEIKNPSVGKDARSLLVQFSNKSGSVEVPFQDLSDGEKCFMICAMVLAANESYGPVLCFWDEPDNHLALSEVAHFVGSLRQAFQKGGQFIATSHNPEAIRRFSEESTLVLSKRSHLEPSIVRPLSEISVKGDLIEALTLGDLDS